MKTRYLFIPLFCFVALSHLSAQETFKVHNRPVPNEDEARLRRDTRELEAFRTKAGHFNDAFEKHDYESLQKTKSDIVSDMKREIAQGRKSRKQYKKDFRLSEMGNSVEEEDIGDNPRVDHPPVDSRSERKARKLRQRDMKGDFMALTGHKEILRRQKSILSAFKNYDFAKSKDYNQADKKRGLVDEFAKAMDDDIRLMKLKMDHEKKREK